MKLAKTFENVHWMFDPLLNRGLMNLMSHFEAHGVSVELRRAIKIGKTGVNTSVSLTINDAEIRDGYTEYAKDVQFVLKRREQDGIVQARAHADVSFEKRTVANLLEPEECGKFAESLLEMMKNRGMAAQVPVMSGSPAP